MAINGSPPIDHPDPGGVFDRSADQRDSKLRQKRCQYVAAAAKLAIVWDQYLPRAISPRHAHSAERSLGQRALCRHRESLPPSAQPISRSSVRLTDLLRAFGVVQAKFKDNKNPSGGLYFDCRSCPLKGDVRLLIFHKSTVLLSPSHIAKASGLSWTSHARPCCASPENFATVVQHHVHHTNTTHL